MATGKSCYGRSNYRFLPGGHLHHSFASDSSFELSESDIYNSASSKSPEMRRSVAPGARISKKPSPKRSVESGDWGGARGGGASSLPVNIPDWSKILKEEYREKSRWEYDEDSEGDGDSEDGMRVPPHEFLARTRMASFSVHEGIGRTLKGRDLSRVRNAIWEKTGFQD
ncbi:uncharacterized protein LOC111011233 [Momordica charantia]|uniref:Uncharacterized protein LOC111011233 n=1 Tax=Momordica charantia TaxID=3673 RepID=A0A6J1CIE6_MOMCH|nr:uncharacterized protein LOC111011233 [Momordica charantia]